nr:MAG TPA: hypothetical protein [Caudoviricetes sp.]
MPRRVVFWLGFGRPPGVGFQRVLPRYSGEVGGIGVKSRVVSEWGLPRVAPRLSPPMVF